MSVYRYLEPVHAAAMLAMGTVRIGTTASFAALENELADGLDSGAALNLKSRTASSPALSADEAKGITRFGVFDLRGSEDVRIDGLMMTAKYSGHALCFCKRPDNTHILNQGRTAVIEITDLSAFVREVTQAAGGRLCDSAQLSEVHYGEREWTDPALAERANVFVKREKFRIEDEYRAYWPTRGPVTSLFVTSVNLTQWMRRVA